MLFYCIGRNFMISSLPLITSAGLNRVLDFTIFFRTVREPSFLIFISMSKPSVVSFENL